MKPQTMLTWLMVWKVPSVAVQIFFSSLIASQGSSSEPFLDLKTIAYIGAGVASLRAIDALLDMTFGRIVHGNTQADLDKIADETSIPTTTDPKTP